MSNYTKKARRYTEDDVTRAAERVISKEISDRKISKDTGIGRQVIRRKIMDLKGDQQLKKQGRKNMLDAEKEAELATVIKDMADAGFAPTPKQVLSIAVEYAEVNEIQNPGFNPRISPSKRHQKNPIWRPTRRWLRRFMDRNKLSKKRTKGMHIGRFNNIKNPFLINGFYELLGSQIEKLNLAGRPECIWNLDESGFPTDPNNIETVSRQGQKVVKVIAGTGRENITVLAACNAAGVALPPLIVYSSKAASLSSIPPEWAGDQQFTIPGTWYGLSSKGWMTTEVFQSWFNDFAEKIKQRPLLLILDGHISHLSMETRRKATNEQITIMKLPSHTTSKLQPLDIAVFGPLKRYWADQMNNWLFSTGFPIRAMTKKQFVNNLSAIWEKGLSPENIKSGFASVGIYPYNPEKYDKSAFDPKLVQKYDKWLEQGCPDEMDEEETEVPEQRLELSIDLPKPPPPLDEDGNPRKGKWIWVEESAPNSPASHSTSSPNSFLGVVASRFNQGPAQQVGAKKKRPRVNMNASIITHEEIERAIQSTPKRPAAKSKRRISSSSSSESEIDELGSLASIESEEASIGSDNDDELNEKLSTIQKLLNDDDWEENVGGKLFAVHFDKPRKFYIGRLNKVFCKDEGEPVNQASFKFLDFRGEGRFVNKPGAPMEFVPAKDIFYGPISSELAASNAILIEDYIFKEITQIWKQFCEAYGR